MLKAYSLDARIASIGSQLIDRVHQVAKNLENLPVYKNPHNWHISSLTQNGRHRTDQLFVCTTLLGDKSLID